MPAATKKTTLCFNYLLSLIIYFFSIYFNSPTTNHQWRDTMPNPETGFFVSASVALAGLSWNESHRSILLWVKHTQVKPYDSSALWIR